MLFRRTMVAVGAAALVTIPGAAAQAASVTDARPPSPGSAAVATAPASVVRAAPSAQDEAFLRAANEINLAGIAHGRIAWAKTGNAEVKKIAGRLMVDHIRLNAKVSEAARKLKIRLGFTPNAAQEALAERYRAAPAGSFDALYLSTQLELHQQAKRIADAQIAKGRDASLKRIAADSAPVLAGHQALLRQATN